MSCKCRIKNRCNSVVPFSWRQYATADDEFDSAAADMSDILRETSVWPQRPDQQDMLDSLSSGTDKPCSAELHMLVQCSPQSSACMQYVEPSKGSLNCLNALLATLNTGY